MKIAFECTECIRAGALNDGEEVRLPLNNDGVYAFTCPRGHEQRVVIQHLRFEVLADTAIQAIADGYYRDAITSFSAALERFYEYYIGVVAFEGDVPEPEFQAFWRRVAASSERQLGVFLATYFKMNNRPPPDLQLEKMRNNVVHKGYVPTEAEAISFGNAVRTYVQTILDDLFLTCPKGSGVMWHQHIKAATDIASAMGGVTSYHTGPTVFNMGPAMFERPSLVAQIAQLKLESLKR